MTITAKHIYRELYDTLNNAATRLAAVEFAVADYDQDSNDPNCLVEKNYYNARRLLGRVISDLGDDLEMRGLL